MLAAASLVALLLSPVLLPHTAAPIAPALVALQGRPEAPGANEARQAMQKLAWLAGRWHGTATVMQGPGGGMKIQQSEDVRYKIFDTTLLIEGTGREPGADGKPGEIVFQALAVVTYDPQTKGYKMRAITERGSVDPRIDVGEKELTWGFSTPGGMVRYHITLDEQGRWHETGEFSRDEGATWTKMLEMTLERVEEKP